MDHMLDNALIDIAIALCLVYALLSLLLMKLQENIHGNLLGGRVANLHQLVKEAVLQDEGLAQQIFDNPLIFALYQGDHASSGKSWLGLAPASGPSAIPPPLFARALLMELNPSGLPPQEGKLPPAEFVQSLADAAPANSQRRALARALQALLPGNEGSWPGFEAALADWFAAVGERSQGWWKRRSSLVGFWLAVALCAVLNIDSGHIATAIAEDTALRGALVDIAGDVQQLRESDARGPAAGSAAVAAPGTATLIVDAETRTVSRLVDAIARLRSAYVRDPAVRSFGFYAADVAMVCKGLASSVLPPSASTSEASATRGPAPAASYAEGRYLSNADTWQRVLPPLLASVEGAVTGTSSNGAPVAELREAHRCLVEVSAWVRAANGVAGTAETRRLMDDAAVALEDSKAGLLQLLRRAEAGGNVRRLFRADPETYVACASQAASRPGLAALENCVRGRQNIVARLPIGHGQANWHAQFCRVAEVRNSAASASAPEPGWTPPLCADLQSKAIPALQVPALELRFQGWFSVIAWLLGVLVSALFISLGAPFWFDLLSKVMRVRSSSLLRDEQAGMQRGLGAQPLAFSAAAAGGGGGGGGAGAARPGGSAGERSTLPLVKGAGNAFEDTVSVREVQALQQVLGVKASGEFDSDTRTALRNATRERGLGETEFLSAATYAALVGRPAVQARDALGSTSGSRLQRGQGNALVPLLAQHLEHTMSAFHPPAAAGATRFDDELRALAVLWRYKAESAKAPHQRTVFAKALSNPAQFDEVDEALLREIAAPGHAPVARDAAPWLDWAIGELGQVEAGGSSRGTSNARICAYLDALEPPLGALGDVTPWCGAFVTWVLKRHNERDTPSSALDIAKGGAAAASWIGWQLPGAPSGAPLLPGHVAVVKVGKGHHVGFVVEVDPANNRFWMLGGNQDKGTCVCLSQFSIDALALPPAPGPAPAPVA